MDWNIDWTWEEVPEDIKEQFFHNDPKAYEVFQQQQADISMSLSLEGRVANKADLEMITGVAEAQDLNRRLKKSFIKTLDPGMNSLLRPILIHRQANMQPAPPHMRCEGYFAVKGADLLSPHIGILDVPMELFIQLPTVSQVKRANGMASGDDEITRFINEYEKHYRQNF